MLSFRGGFVEVFHDGSDIGIKVLSRVGRHLGGLSLRFKAVEFEVSHKYENVYLKGYETIPDTEKGLKESVSPIVSKIMNKY